MSPGSEDKLPGRDAISDLRLLHETMRRVAAIADAEEALGRVLNAALAMAGAPKGLLSLCEAAADGVRVKLSVGFDEAFLRKIGFAAAGMGVCGTAFERGERVVVEDAATDAVFAALPDAAREGGFVSCHSVPLLLPGKRAAGVLTLHFTERHLPDERERMLLDLYAQMAAGIVVRQRESEQVRQSEERFQLVASHAPVGIFLSDDRGDSLFLNEAWCALAGMTADEEKGKGWTRALHPEDRERVIAGWGLAVREGAPSTAEFRFLRPDGTVAWLQGTAVQMRDRAGRVTGYIGTVIDITGRREADMASRRLAAIVESSDDAIVSKDLNGIVQSWNAGAQRIFGYTPEEMIGQPVTRLIPSIRLDEEPGIIARIRAGERVDHYETTRMRKDGSLIEVSLTVSPIHDRNGEVVGASKIARDITARKRADAELRRQEKLHRAIGESINYGIWVCDGEGRNMYASDSFLRLVGMTQEECSSLGWSNVLHPDEIEATRKAWRECIATGGVWEREHRFKGVDGEWHPVLARGVPIRDEDGTIVHWAGINLDIAAFKETENALRRGEQQLRLVTDNAIVFLAQCDRNYRLKFVNRPYAERFGRAPAELVGKTIAELVGEVAFHVFKPHVDAAFAGRRVEFETEIPYERLGPRWMRVIHEPERDEKGEVVGLVAVIMDITARKIAEREVEAARDRALAASRAKDDFLAALSHELRTPLNPVLLLASEAEEDASLPKSVREDFGTIRKNVELEARLIDDLLDLTRISRGKLSLNLAMLDVASVVQDAVATMRLEIQQKRIELKLEFDGRAAVVWGDAVRLQQVLWNVLKNAVKFTDANGRITVRTRVATDDEQFEVEVIDSGIGMTREELARAFEAFSQGDHAGQSGSHRFGGVGLGLAISRMLVEMHRGTIEAQSEGRGRGSRFTLQLPLVSQAEQDSQGSPPRFAGSAPRDTGAGAAGQRRRILLVEDHGPTRAALAQLLTRRNYDVVTAASVSEARVHAEAGGIDLLVSDVGLPDGNGYELMAELSRRYQLRGIALTGYGMDQDVMRSQAAGFIVHLTKPVTIQALDKALGSIEPVASDR